MRAYVEKIDITSNGKVVVSGHLSRANLKVTLSEHIYVKEPKDGIWGYTLSVVPTSALGAEVLVPFSVEAPWTGNAKANGLRIIQPNLVSGEPDHETVLLKAKKVKKFTTEQVNFVALKGASYDPLSKQLIIDATYHGGCFSHLFALEWDGLSLESFPPQYCFNLVDLSEYDPCKAILSTQLRFDIEVPEIQLDKPAVIRLSTVTGGSAQIKVELHDNDLVPVS